MEIFPANRPQLYGRKYTRGAPAQVTPLLTVISPD